MTHNEEADEVTSPGLCIECGRPLCKDCGECHALCAPDEEEGTCAS